MENTNFWTVVYICNFWISPAGKKVLDGVKIAETLGASGIKNAASPQQVH